MILSSGQPLRLVLGEVDEKVGDVEGENDVVCWAVVGAAELIGVVGPAASSPASVFWPAAKLIIMTATIKIEDVLFADHRWKDDACRFCFAICRAAFTFRCVFFSVRLLRRFFIKVPEREKICSLIVCIT